MEKFYVLNQDNEYYEFHSWEKLVDWLDRIDLSCIGHNFNDTYVTFRPIVKNGEFYSCPSYHNVGFVVFDSLWRVVDKETLSKGIENKDRKYRRRKHYFEYRREPVPGTGKWKNGSSNIRKNIKKNKSYAAKLEDFNDVKTRYRKWLVRTFNDELSLKTQDRSWKRQNKVRKQWQKNT